MRTMARLNKNIIRDFVRLLIVILFASIISACANHATVPINMAAHKMDYEKKTCLRHANYRFQKKYDILEKSLIKENRRYIKKKSALGQLYTSLDLADFYSYGFINYAKSLEYYAAADELNKQIKENEFIGDEAKIIFYKIESNYALPRKYDFDRMSARIETSRERIRRILGEHSTDFDKGTITGQNKTFAEIKTLMTNQYAHAIQVSKDILDPEQFDDFEQELVNKTRDYFNHRHKLSKEKKTFYTYYNISKGMISSFDFSTLSISQVERILKLINNAAAFNLTKEVDPQKTYLKFGRILCLSRMERHKEVMHHFNVFQKDVNTIQQKSREHIEYLRKYRKKAIVKGAVMTAAFLALDIITMGQAMSSGGGSYTKLTAAGVQSLADIPSLTREMKFVGESEYSKDLNILLNVDEQLQLFRAVGQSYHCMGNTKESIFYNKQAVNIINNLRSTISSERHRIRFAGYKDIVYNNLVDDLIRNNDNEEAFFYSESARSRALVDLLGSRKGLVFKNYEMNQYVHELKNGQIYRDSMRKGTNLSDEQVLYINDLQTSLITERGVTVVQKNLDQEKQTHINDPRELLSLITVCSLKVPEIQALLSDNFSLIEYYISDDQIYAWVMDKTNFKSYRLDITTKQLKRLIRSFYQSRQSNLEDILKISRVLYKKLFAPLGDGIKNKQIYIVGHRFLHFLPFEALNDGKQFLVQRYSFSYIPSASVLQFLKPATRGFQSLLAFGNPEIDYMEELTPLEGAEKETLLIAETFPIKKVYLRQEATETAFRKEAKHYQVLHIASHGAFDTLDPLKSKLILSRDKDNDGMLTVEELYGIQINASLVTLSACETGMSAVENGDELIGFVRGFFFAGTSSLIASLWKIDDIATKKFMSLFYRHLQSKDKVMAQVLQQAKIDMINSKKYTHPFFWAPFNLYGLGF